MSRLTRQRLLCIALIALLAGGLVLFATRDGITTTPDSSVYVGTARSVDAGHGLYVPIHYYPLGSVGIGTPPPGRFAPQPTPLVIYAPGAPVLLSIGGRPIAAARVEDVIFFALAMLVVGLFVLVVCDELWLAVAAQLVIAGSLAGIASEVGTVDASLFFTVVAFVAVIAHRERPRRTWLIVAALSIGLATLVRYADGGLIVWGALALRGRRRDALALLVLSSLPLGAWFAYERISGRGSGHFLGFHIESSSVRGGIHAVSDWVLPSSSPHALAVLAAAVVVVVVFLVVRRRPTTAARLLVLFAVVQVVMLEVAITFFDAGVDLEPLEFIPVFVAVVMAVACAIDRTSAAKLLVGAAVIASLARAGVEISSDVPAYYGSPRWVHSPIMAAVRAVPARTIIYTNAPDAIYLLDDRATSSIPETTDFSTLKPNSRLGAQLAEIRRTLHTRGGLVVYVRGLKRSFLPSEASLVRLLALKLVDDTSDGAIYALARPAS